MLAILKKVDARPPPKFQVNIEIQLNIACVFPDYLSVSNDYGQSKIKWVAFSGSEPQLHIGYIVSGKWGLNLCLFRWLKFSLKRVSNFMLSLS